MRSFFVVFLFFLHEPFHSRTKVKLSPRNIPFTDQSQTISTDHSIHGPKSNYLHGPFHSRANVKLYTRTIPSTDQRQTISTDHSIHGLFHSRTNVKLYPRTIPFKDHLQTDDTDLKSTDKRHMPLIWPSNANNHYSRTIPYTDHSIHGPFTDQCHGPITYRLTSHTASMPIKC